MMKLAWIGVQHDQKTSTMAKSNLVICETLIDRSIDPLIDEQSDGLG